MDDKYGYSRTTARKGESVTNPMERFLKKVKKTKTCWIWTGATNYGYGCFRVDKGMMRAHRYSYSASVGEIPESMLVLHKCDVRNCVRPSHLYLGTDKDNMRDALERNRLRPSSGENHTRAKLNWTKVRAIRKANLRKINIRSLAKQFGVSMANIKTVRYGYTWKS